MKERAVHPSPIDSILGVEVKPLKTHPDSRGFFREIIRSTDDFFSEGFGQWSHSKMGRNTVKAWHFHHRQVDWWYVPIGLVEVVLYDNRKESPSYRVKFSTLLGETELDKSAKNYAVKIPPGVLHGCKVLSETAHLFYITSKTYDPNDEGRLPFNSKVVDQNWGDEKELTVAANDTRTFIPPYERALVTLDGK